jgi:hypothetical protein
VIAAVVIMRPRKNFVTVVAKDHMLFGHTLEVSGLGRNGRVFVLDPDGVEVAVARSEVQPAAVQS